MHPTRLLLLVTALLASTVIAAPAVLPPTALSQTGVLTGWTMTTQAADMSVVSVLLQDEIVQYRG